MKEKATQREKREPPKGSRLEKNKTGKRERDVGGEENKNEIAKYCHFWER